MHQFSLKQAETQLAKLMEVTAGGEDVIIPRRDGASFKIVPITTVVAIPRFGSAKGLVRI